MLFGASFDRFLLVFGALFAFGLAFAWFVDWCGRRGYLDGYTAIFVVVGVLVTEVARLALPYTGSPAENLVIILACYTASGAPMVAADVVKHLNARQRLLALQEEQLRRDREAWEEFLNDGPEIPA